MKMGITELKLAVNAFVGYSVLIAIGSLNLLKIRNG